MPTRLFTATAGRLSDFGEFCIFTAQTLLGSIAGIFRWKTIRLIMPRLYDIGVRSVPVIAITGAFIGMVLAVETYTQFKMLGQEERLGAVIILSVVKQIGPVMASVMLAGRIGSPALAAELGTMNVTEQLDALRVMGTDPIRYLVVPRFVACLLLMPILTIYSDIFGIAGGWLVSVKLLGIPNDPYWHYARASVEMWQINEGIIKTVFFGAAIALISCFKGFNCGAGASGVGRACTDSFVVSFISIIIMNFFFAEIAQEWYTELHYARTLFS